VYPAAALAGSAHPDEAAAFLDFVGSPEGRRILAAAGFLPP
jgi:molybdate transport system substrate-binding protein